MNDVRTKFDNCFSVIGLQMDPIGWNVVPDMACRVVTWPKMAREHGVITFSVVNCSSLLNVGIVINTVSHRDFEEFTET